MQAAAHFLPLTAVNDALRTVILDGDGLSRLARPFAVLGAWSMVTFTVGLKLFRWS